MIAGGNRVLIRSNIKAVSTLVIILLIVISAIIGGLLSYMFTIAFFTRIPEKTTVTITDVYFDKENARSFKISVLNPSYSPANATVTRIALNLKGESQLYDIVATEPPIENGIIIQKGEALNITCLRAQRDSANVSWGRLAGEFAGENVTLHVFSPDSLAANIETFLPFVKLRITDTDFDSKISFNRFNITIMNNRDSEINLTINEITVGGIDLPKENISPMLPLIIANEEAVRFACNGSWHKVMETTLTVFTEEGYVFSQELHLPKVSTIIQDVVFNENRTDRFNVTVFNTAESANYVNVTKIACTLENGTTIERNYPSASIAPNSTGTFTFDRWIWKGYRGKRINVTAYLLQDFETDTFTVTTPPPPPPIIFTVLNEKEVFDLKDKEHFNITLQNHPSSIEAVNITKIVVEETEEVINGTKANPNFTSANPIEPGQAIPFYCSVTNWTEHAGKNLTLTIHAINQALEEYTFEFNFTLPTVILKVTFNSNMSTQYFSVSVQNKAFSTINITGINVNGTWINTTLTYPSLPLTIEDGNTLVILCRLDWQPLSGGDVTIVVTTSNGFEVATKVGVPQS